jgi:type II secretory pathway component GspD/PulD (secretin)
MRKLGLAAASAVALITLATPHALAAEPRRPEPPPPEPEWVREIKRKLERKVSFSFDDTPITEAVTFLRTLTKINMIIDPEVAKRKGTKTVTLKSMHERTEVSLQRILAVAGLDYRLLSWAVFISTPERLAVAQQREAEALREATRLPDDVWEVKARRKFARKVTFEFVETPLTEAIQFLQTLTETTFFVDPVAFTGKNEASASLNVTKLPLTVALRHILRVADLDHGLVDGALFISTRKRIISTRRALHARRFADALRPQTEWGREIRGKLTRSISFELSETPLA